MRQGKLRLAAGLALTLAAVVWALSTSADAQVQYQFKILHGFVYNSPHDGDGPQGGLVSDQKGNLYGVTSAGGAANAGTVFELTPGAGGQWTESILYNFDSFQNDGITPTGVVLDSAGNLYGMTTFGGNGNCFPPGCGTVFKLSPAGNGQWTESIIWDICPPPNCNNKSGALYGPAVDTAGNVYGFDYDAFRLTPGPNGWTYTSLYALPGTAQGPPILDAKGNLYFEVPGIAMRLHPEPNGQWKDVTLFTFNEISEGLEPTGGVTIHGGALYGSTEGGGSNYCMGGCGTVFELTRGGNKTIKDQVLWAFGANPAQGILPVGGVAADPRGNLFGVTLEGGASCGCGVAYGLKSQGNGKWSFAVLHTFEFADGFGPNSRLLLDARGNLYGETGAGGPNGGGTIFELSPTTQASK